MTSLYIRIPKTPRTEPGENDLHYCQRTTASGDCRLRPAGAERSWFGNTIFGWLGNIDGVLFDPLGMLKEKPFQFTESNLGAVEELRHLPATHDRQIATKQHPIEAGQHTMNPFLMLGNEFLHDPGPQDDLLYP